MPMLKTYLSTMLPCLFLLTHCGPAPTTDQSALTEDVATDISEKKIMAVFAHPDDESTVAPILARYAREGAEVYIVIATDGRLGVNDFSGLEAGEGLVAIRKEEMQCAADKLNAKLIHLDYHDQFRAAEGYDGHIPHVRAFLLELYDLVEEIQPDVLISWGPDGGSNHMDHRLTAATVENVYLNRQWDKPSALYYYGTPSNQIEDEESRLLRGVGPSFLRTKISYTDEDFEAAFEALSCHKSQFQLEGLRERMEARSADKAIYLRKFVAPTEDSETLFE